MKDPRKHQIEMARITREIMVSALPLRILVHAVAGGGKSALPCIAGQEFPDFKIGWFVPRVSLKEQAAESAKEHFGMELRESENESDPSRGRRGFIATHAALTENPDIWIQELERCPYILIIDEIHHAKIWEALHNPLSRVIDRLRYRIRIDMTGTLDTNDGGMINGVRYETNGRGLIAVPDRSADCFIRYTRGDAMDDKAIVPIEFYHHDGKVSYADKVGKHDDVVLSSAGREQEGKALFTALNTNMADDLFHVGVEHWRRHGDGLIVVTASQSDARRYHQILKDMGITAAEAITDNIKAHAEVKLYRTRRVQALVTCAMAYEGLDAPHSTHEICLTRIRSIPWIEQMFGRIWRAHKGKTQCWAFVPDDPKMKRVIAAIQAEQIAAIYPPEDGPPPPPGPKDTVIPLNGSLTDIRQSYLDGHMSGIAFRETVMRIFAEHGIDNPALVAEVIAAAEKERRLNNFQAAAFRGTSDETPRQEEMRLRKKMWEECKRADWEKDVPKGTHQRCLYKQIRKRFEDMTIVELRSASVICARICS